MSKILLFAAALVVLLVMEGVSLAILKSPEETSETALVEDRGVGQQGTEQEQPMGSNSVSLSEISAIPDRKVTNTDLDSFPPPTTEVKNGRTERTIHMGVRQYVWDPSIITAKQGELVRLIVHNADVQHGLVIPDLNVLNIGIPSEGAVIEFVPEKIGTFAFFCSYYCGEGHGEMRGKIIVEP